MLIIVTGCGKNKSEETRHTIDDLNVLESSISVENVYTEAVPDIEMTDEVNEKMFEESIENAPYPSPYKYYDVFRNEYEMDIDVNVPANQLKPENFVYIDTDASGRKLTDDNFSFDNPKKAADGQLLGYEGIIKYEDDKFTSKFGVDVSKFQGDIDWTKAKEAGVEFAIVRIGFRGYGKVGDLNEDAYYKKNIEGAHNAGIDVGVYLYAQAVNEEEAIEEADFVLDLLEGYSLELPIVYDPEHVLNDDARTDNVTGEQFTKNARAFCDSIKAAGFTPMIYANMLWQAKEFNLSELSDIDIWFADYEFVPQSPYKFTLWQYSQNGNVSGIKGGCDLDLMIIPK